jgi:hypothetical protein
MQVICATTAVPSFRILRSVSLCLWTTLNNDVLAVDLGRKYCDRMQDKTVCTSKSDFVAYCCRSGHTNSLQCNAFSGGQWIHAMAGRYEDGSTVARRHPFGVQEKGTYNLTVLLHCNHPALG